MPYFEHTYYEEAGTGQSVVLIHCPALSHAYWRPIVDRLSNRFRCVMPDLRGHGRSGMGDLPWTFREAAGDISQLIHRLRLERPIVVTYSAGGCVALEAALAEPGLFSGLVLVSGFSQCNTLYLKAKVMAGRAASRLGLTRIVGSSIAETNHVDESHKEAVLADARQVEPVSLRSFLRESYRVNLTGLLPRVEPPVLLIYGANDTPMLGYARQLKDGLRDAQLVLVPGCDHRVPTRRPELLAETVGGFATTAAATVATF